MMGRRIEGEEEVDVDQARLFQTSFRLADSAATLAVDREVRRDLEHLQEPHLE
jgi:hypothetical protein